MTRKIKLKISARLLKKGFHKQSSSIKRCRFCGSEQQEQQVDYKNASFLKGFLTERGKILASRISGNCAKHQRFLAHQIKKSRIMALIPYTALQV